MLLSYIYNGEVSVEEEILPSLVKAAEYLQIEGLSFTSNNEEDENLTNNIDYYKENNILTPNSTCYIKNEIMSDTEDIYDSNQQQIDSCNQPQEIPVEAIIKEEINTIEDEQPISVCTKKRKRKPTLKKFKLKKNNVNRENYDNLPPTCDKNDKDYEYSMKEHNILDLYKNMLSNIQTENDTEAILHNLEENLTKGCEDRGDSLCLNSVDLQKDENIRPTFLNSVDLQKDENIRPTFPCPFCHRIYYSWGYRRRHVKAHHESNSLTCKLCFTTLDSEVMWFEHVVSVHRIPKSQARDSLVIMVEAHSVLSFSSPPSPVSMLHHLQLKSGCEDDLMNDQQISDI